MKTLIWTHYDLDGVISYLLFNWNFKQIIPYKTTTARKFRNDFTSWLVNNNIDDYDKIYILDLDVSDHKDLIDKKNVFIIDHHKSHVNNGKYENATAVVKEYKSAAELIYRVFTKLYNVQLTPEQKKMVLYASDYDSYTLQLPDSIKLNSVFWGTNKSFDSFVTNFSKGFYGFNVEQENIIRLYYQRIDKLKTTCPIYNGKIVYDSKPYNVYATFADELINEVADWLINDYHADIAIVVTPKNDHISFRRNKDIKDLDLLKVVEQFGEKDQFGGHELAVGSSLTTKFLEYTKTLNQIK